jgi:hypothetical protein
VSRIQNQKSPRWLRYKSRLEYRLVLVYRFGAVSEVIHGFGHAKQIELVGIFYDRNYQVTVRAAAAIPRLMFFFLMI